MSPFTAEPGTRKARRVGRLIKMWAGSPPTRTAGGPKLSGPRATPVSSISARGSAAAGTTSSTRGGGNVGDPDWEEVRAMLFQIKTRYGSLTIQPKHTGRRQRHRR